MLVGGSQCGKSTYCEQIIKERERLIYPCDFKKIIWYSPTGTTNKSLKEVEYVTDLPDLQSIPANSLLVLDDCFTQLLNTSEFTNFIIREVHHRNLFLLFINHSLFSPSRFGRAANVNFQYLILFNNPRDKLTCSNLARQTIIGKKLDTAYKMVTCEAFQPILIDFTQCCENKYRLRSHIFSKDICSRFYY